MATIVFRHIHHRIVHDMAQWCYDVIGAEARLACQLSDRYLWCTSTWGFSNEFHFHRDEDAVLFKLMWM